MTCPSPHDVPVLFLLSMFRHYRLLNPLASSLAVEFGDVIPGCVQHRDAGPLIVSLLPDQPGGACGVKDRGKERWLTIQVVKMIVEPLCDLNRPSRRRPALLPRVSRGFERIGGIGLDRLGLENDSR